MRFENGLACFENRLTRFEGKRAEKREARVYEEAGVRGGKLAREDG